MAATDSTRICEIAGCKNELRARGMCATHWGRWRKNGDPLVGARVILPDTCSVERCDRKARSRFKGEGAAYCAMHYLQLHNRGEVILDPPTFDSGRDCEVHGCEARVRSPGALWCEKHYARNRRLGTPLAVVMEQGGHKHCCYCGSETQGKKFCSYRCSTRYLRGTPRHQHCALCGQEFEPVYGAEFCSHECRRIQKQQYSDIRRMVSSLNEDGRKARYAVFKRDNWVCQICGDPTDRKARWPDPMYPTIDHVIPVSKGGKHEVANLQCAHARCNVRKQATMPTLIEATKAA